MISNIVLFTMNLSLNRQLSIVLTFKKVAENWGTFENKVPRKSSEIKRMEVTLSDAEKVFIMHGTQEGFRNDGRA